MKLKQKDKKAILIKQVVDFFSNNKDSVVNYKQIAHKLGLKEQERKLLPDILNKLTKEDYLKMEGMGKFRLNQRGRFVIGRIDRTTSGKTFLIPEDGGEDIFIAERNTHHALNKDIVRVFLRASRKRQKPEGEVIEIIERARTQFVGVLSVSKNYAFLVIDNRVITNDIFIPLDKLNGGKDGEKAVVKIIEWPDDGKNPIGEVIDVLGTSGDNNTEMHAILAEYGLPYKYPEDVTAFAEKIDPGITDEEISKRVDYRDITTFTIDPFDAKDFDDALSIKTLENGNFEVGVHIADVSHYMTEGSILDNEARERATSVYLVDRTIPMLPERLCNFICSLRPNEEKLAYSVLFEINQDAEIINHKICKTVIRSNRRFTYEEALEIIQNQEGDYKNELSTLNTLAKKIREKRFANGSINFERSEVRFKIDENGKPLSVYIKEATDATQLVEEFMLLANKTVAKEIGYTAKGEKEKTFVYRIHDKPDPDKLSNFSTFIQNFGYKPIVQNGRAKDITASINNILNKSIGKKEQNLIETLAIRSMAKAAYSTDNIGHYGLSFDYYTHFTSPIRRYPDVMVHRLLTHYLNGGKSVNKEEYEDLCIHCSGREQLAASAERSSIKYKQVEFLSDKIDQVFDGVISGVTDWGFYVELNANKCEGMVSIRTLDDDFYFYDEKNYRLIGRQTKKTYCLGDEVTIKIARANLEKKQLDFVLV